MSGILVARESYAFFVFHKGGRPPARRLNTFDEAVAEMERIEAEHPNATLIVARELVRRNPKERAPDV